MDKLSTHCDDDTRRRYRRAILGRAVERRAELLERIVSAVAEELPEVANGWSARDLEDMRAGVHQSIELCLSVIERPRSLTDDERSAVCNTGAQRARQGIPKPVVLGSVKIAVRVGRSFLMTCTDVGDDAEALMGAFRDITAILDRFEDEFCSCLSEGHDEAWGDVLSAADRGEAVLVDRLLEHRFVVDEEILGHAAEVGLSRHREARVVAVASVGAGDEALLRATANELRTRAMAAVGPLRFAHRLHLPVVVQPRDSHEWAELVDLADQVGRRHGTTVVWSEQGVALVELAPVYRSVREGLEFLAAATRSPGAVSSLITRFHRSTCSGTPSERAAVLAEVLSPLQRLPERDRTELLDALDALYETGASVAALARHLHVHKNTVVNRMRRVQEVLGLDVRKPAERLVLDSALRMRFWQGAEAP